MKEKTAKFVSWLPTIVLGVIALLLIISLFLPSSPKTNATEPNKVITTAENNADKEFSASDETAKQEEQKETQSSFTDSDEKPSDESYLLNTNSKKFHLSSCKSGQRTKESNRLYLSDRERIIEMGYDPCKICNP